MSEPRNQRHLKLAAKALARSHLAVHRFSRGRLGRQWDGRDIAFITTTGRRSGRPHTTPLACIPHRDGIAVVASCGGSHRTPDWWLNLQHQPRAEVEFGGTKRAVVARAAGAAEQAPLTNRFSKTYPRFDRYRRRSSRIMPIVLLTSIANEDGSGRLTRG